jgi:UDP-GlcNAc3NAcA epimerase
MKILTIIGARPQFIKAATVSRAISEFKNLTEIIVHTGQHFDTNMSDVFFDEMGIPKPDYHLGIGGGNHGNQTGKMLIKIEDVLLIEKPDWVLVYGDTNSTLAGALAASKLHIPIAHVEAGLRSYNKKMPEEINRILTDNVSDILFTPTYTANQNLIKEGVDNKKIKQVGDVMYDAALFYSNFAESKSDILNKYNLSSKNFILCTIHRAENTDDRKRLLDIFHNLESVSQKHKLILPLHPRTKGALENINFNLEESNIEFIDPVGYMDMIMLEKHSKLIITDSGGVQKEAYFHKVPCITLRDETEWTELVEHGYNKLIENFGSLPEEVDNLLKNIVFNNQSLYGDGDSASKIIEILSA